jgi:hypothetical protein
MSNGPHLVTQPGSFPIFQQDQVPQGVPDAAVIASDAAQPIPQLPDNTNELLSRITHLLQTIDDMRIAQEKSNEEKSELLKKLSDADSVVLDKLKEIDTLNGSLCQTQKELVYISKQFDETKKQLGQAKEMWMKESSRATKLRDELDKSEVQLSDKDREISSMIENFKKYEIENNNLKNIINRSNEMVSTSVMKPTESKFSPNDSYFVKGTTMADLSRHPIASMGRISIPSDNRLFTSKQMQDPRDRNGRYLQLCMNNDGILYEDEIIQIGLKAKYTGIGEGVFGVYFGNKTSGILNNFQVRYDCVVAVIHLTTSPMSSCLAPKNQVCQRVSVQISGPFIESPKIIVSFLLPDNTPRMIPLKLPLVISKFIQGRELNVDAFFSNWRNQLFLINESSSVVNVEMNLAQIARACCLGGALTLHHQIDENPDNIILVGQFPSDSSDGIRCATIPEAIVLVRAEVGTGSNVGKVRVATRSNDPTVAEAVCDCIVQQLSTT